MALKVLYDNSVRSVIINMFPKITVEDILDRKNEDTVIYRDIFRYTIPTILESLSEHDKIREIEEGELAVKPEWNTAFRITELAKWLVDNNKKIRKELSGSRISKSEQALSKTTYVTRKLNHLMHLGLLVDAERGQSEENGQLETAVYDFTRNGVIVALTIEISNHDNKSSEYAKILKFLYNEWKSFVPEGYRDHSNIGYHLIEQILDECIISYLEFLLDFINIVSNYRNGYYINFSVLRYRLNCLIFSKICSDERFKEFFYKIINNFDIFREIKEDQNDPRLEEHRKQDLRLLKFQFKLDVESYIDKCFSEYLKINSDSIKSFAWGQKEGNQNKTVGEVERRGLYREIMKEVVLTFEIKKEWEKKRNQNLLNFDQITLLVKCKECDQIYPYNYNFETDSFSNIVCKFCNNKTIIQYIFENELNAQYHKKIANFVSTSDENNL